MSTYDVHARNKAALAPLRAAQYNYQAEAVRAALAGRAVGRVRRKGADRKPRAAAACPAESVQPRSTPQ